MILYFYKGNYKNINRFFDPESIGYINKIQFLSMIKNITKNIDKY